MDFTKENMVLHKMMNEMFTKVRMRDMCEISIIVPIYKVKEEYLRRCIESLMKQTFHDIEMILVDDGSPDCSGKICDEYAGRDTRLKVLHCKNQGVSVARNTGIDYANGKYIMFVDADDWIEEELCEKVVREAEKQKTEVLIFGYDEVGTNRKKEFPILETNEKILLDKETTLELQLRILRYTKKFLSVNICTPWGKLYSKDFIRRNKICFRKGLKRGEDMLFNLAVLEYAESISFYSFIGYHYRINELSESQSYTPQILEISREIIEGIEEFGKQNNKEKVFYEGVSAYTIETLYEQMYMYFFHISNSASRKKKVEEFMEQIKTEPYHSAAKRVRQNRVSMKIGILKICLQLHFARIFAILYCLKEERRAKIGDKNNCK